MNKRLRLAVRQADCRLCPLHEQADGDDRCVTGRGPNGASIVVVTKFPLAETSRIKAEILTYLRDAGIDVTQIMWCSAFKCQVWDADGTKSDLKKCTPYLRQELAFLNPQWVLAFGAEAWFAVSGWADITKHRGHLYDVVEGDGKIFPTISPSAVTRSPGLRGGFVADLRYFASLVNGQSQDIPFHTPGVHQTTVASKTGLRDMLRRLRASTVVAYDVETIGAAEYEPDAAIVSLSLTTADDTGMPSAHVWKIPLFHPESPFRNTWQAVLRAIAKALCAVKRRVAHNAKYDTKWLRHFGVPITPTFDTIIALALLDENEPKGLKPACQQRLGAEPWGIDTRNLLTTPLGVVLDYNGLDTWHDLRLYYMLRKELASNPRSAKLFRHLMMPLVVELVDVERKGVYVDQERLATNHAEVKGILARIHTDLMEYVPDREEWPDNIKAVNFNASNFARWWLFDYLELPVLASGKTGPSMAEDVMTQLAELHPAAKLMAERVEWNKYDNGSFTPWTAQIDSNSRIHTTFKPWGTRTGRLSSGKEDAEKITVGNRGRKGVNLQQVPRNKLARSVFGAPPGWTFVEADYSQIELRLAAWMAQEHTMLRLYAMGEDIHLATAMRMTGKPASQITPEERKKAKAVNFGFLYGMGWAKFIYTAWNNFGIRVSEEEARAYRKAFFDGFPRLLPWHGRQRRLVNKYGRVQTPMGRVRHLPDITSPNEGVRAEAERQAINSPVQAMASDMAALSFIHVSREFRKQGMESFAVGLVHDAVNYEIRDDELTTALPIIQQHMENLPLPDLFGVEIGVPILADIKTSQNWGLGIEVPHDTVTNPRALRAWLSKAAA